MALTPNEISQILKEFFDTVGTRQYIGARYVPIFGRKGETSIDWDNSKPYEPLTIVLYEGNSFTSRQYVPTGIDIDNTDFWASTGNYNAQIEQYRQETQAVSDQMVTLQRQVDGTLDEMDEEIAELTLSVGPIIENAKLIYRNLSFLGSVSNPADRPSPQGTVVFPANDNWDSGVFYAANVINPAAQDQNCTFNIIDIQTRSVIANVELGETHGGCVFYRDGKLYVPMYHNTSATSPRLLRTYDVSNPYTPTLISEVSYAGLNIDVPFGKTDDGFICYGPKQNASMQQGIYSWDGASSSEWLFDVAPLKTDLGKRTQPYCYDVVHEHIIVPFADCCGYLTYDMEGTLLAHKGIAGEIGFVTVGELESVNVHGDDVWFTGFSNTAAGTIYSYALWHWNPSMNGVSTAPQSRAAITAFNIRLAPTNTFYPLEAEGYSTSTNIDLASPDDALNMAKYLGKHHSINIFQQADYDCLMCLYDYAGMFSANGHFATCGYYFCNVSGLIHGNFNFARVDTTKLKSDLAGSFSPSSNINTISLPVAIVFQNCNVEIFGTTALTHDATYIKFRFMASVIRMGFAAANAPILDCVIDKTHFSGIRQPKLSYSIIGHSIIQTCTVEIAKFDNSTYIIGAGTSLASCFVVDGVDSASALLVSHDYYIGSLGSANNAWHYLPLADTTRLAAVTDRLHTVSLPYCYPDANNEPAIAKLGISVASETLRITPTDASVTTVNCWTA